MLAKFIESFVHWSQLILSKNMGVINTAYEDRDYFFFSS